MNRVYTNHNQQLKPPATQIRILTLPEKVADTEITKAADVNIAIVNGCAQACGVYTIGSQTAIIPDVDACIVLK